MISGADAKGGAEHARIRVPADHCLASQNPKEGG